MRRLRLVRGPAEYRVSRARWTSRPAGEPSATCAVRADGTVAPSAARCGRSPLRMDVTDVDAPSAAGARRLLDAVAIGEVEIPGLHPPAPPRHGRFRTRCGDLVVRSRLVVRDGDGLREPRGARPRGARCGWPECGTRRSLDLPAGTGLVTAAGHDDAALPAQPALAGRVRELGPAAAARRRRVAGQRRRRLADRGAPGAATGRPGSSSARATRGAGGRRAARATAKERELGAPEPIDGFANGWRVGRLVRRRAEFWFAPQRLATVSYVVSALAGLAILPCSSCCRCGVRRRGAARGRADDPAGRRDVPPADSVLRLDWRAALAVGDRAWAPGSLVLRRPGGRAARRRRRVPHLAGR